MIDGQEFLLKKRIEEHIPNIKQYMPYNEVYSLIADKLDEYKTQIDEKEKIIARLLGEIK